MEGERITIVVPEHKSKERIDVFLTHEVSRVSRSQIQRLIKEGCVTLSGKPVKANHYIQPSEIIEIVLSKPRPPDVIAENIHLDIVFEDDFLLVIHKKAGMVVHPAFGNYSGTLVNALLAHCKRLSSVNDVTRPGIVHRLDKDTSGLLVVAKDDETHRHLAAQFFDKSVKREYVAVVWGHPKKLSGTIDTHLARSVKDRRRIRVSAEGKRAVTHYTVVERFRLASLLKLVLGTGRTHQIRVHLSHMGHPVFGDQTYGGRSRMLGGFNQSDTALGVDLLKMMPRQALHAKSLGFIHPQTENVLQFDSEIPEDMAELLKKLEKSPR